MDDIDSDSTDGGSKIKVEIDSKLNKLANSNTKSNEKKTKNMKFGSEGEGLNQENQDKEILIHSQMHPIAVKRKSRIVLDEINLNKKEGKNYAMEFESLYDNYERDVNFVDNIDSLNSLNSNSFKEKDFSGSFKKRSSIIPYGKKSSKKEELVTENFNNEVDEFFKQHSNSLKINRKSSILGILESNVNYKKSLNDIDIKDNNFIPNFSEDIERIEL